MQISKPFAINETVGRTDNEENIFPQKNKADEKSRFFMICDGTGRRRNGETASNIVCESFSSFLKNTPPDNFDETLFDRALNFAFDELDKKSDKNETTPKTGTTLAFLYLNNKQAFMAHIGNSRIYHLRTNDMGEVCILYQSTDHFMVEDLPKTGEVSEDNAVRSPKKRIVTRLMQPHLKKCCKAEIHITPYIQAGDRFFICSDGVIESLTNERLCAIAGKKNGDEAMINAIQALCKNHSRDNFSAWLISVVEGIEPAEEKSPEPPKPATPPKDKDKEPSAGTNKKSRKSYFITLALTCVLLGLGAYFLHLKKQEEIHTQMPAETSVEPLLVEPLLVEQPFEESLYDEESSDDMPDEELLSNEPSSEEPLFDEPLPVEPPPVKPATVKPAKPAKPTPVKTPSLKPPSNKSSVHEEDEHQYLDDSEKPLRFYWD